MKLRDRNGARNVVRVDRFDLGSSAASKGHVGRVYRDALVAGASIAWIGLNPPSAARPRPGSRLLHASEIVEVVATRPLQAG